MDATTVNASLLFLNATDNPTCDDQQGLESFRRDFNKAHGYLSIIVCVFGIICNVLNIIVLMQKNMISSTNILLTALAFADLFTMIAYVPFTIYVSIVKMETAQPQAWILVFFYLINSHLNITLHTISMWLTVALAVFRYIAVCHHNLGPKLCNLRRAKLTILAVNVFTIAFCIPNYTIYNIQPVRKRPGKYVAGKFTFVTAFHRIFNFWLFGVVLKIAPCVLLTILSTLLIRAMHAANKKRQRLKSQGRRAESERTADHNRTTAMLVTVVLCFVLTELPQGILAFLSGMSNSIFVCIYTPLGDTMDFVVLVNSSLNFCLYCTMSRQFRHTFNTVILTPCRFKVRSVRSCSMFHHKSNENSPQHMSVAKATNGSTVQYSTIQTQCTKL